MASKKNRYDVFKNDKSNVIETEEIVVKKSIDDPFKDFAKAAFSEFKVDKTIGHEFSNKLSDAKNKSFQPMNAKVIYDRTCVTLHHYCCKNVSLSPKKLTHNILRKTASRKKKFNSSLSASKRFCIVAFH
jgi:hypothetical protein